METDVDNSVEMGITGQMDEDAPQWWTRPKRVLRAEVLPGDPLDPASLVDHEPPNGVGITVLQGVSYDPGSAAYRFHSAVNETTPHASLFAVLGENNPFSVAQRQIDVFRDLPTFRRAMRECDVLHLHVDLELIALARVGRKKRGSTHWDGALIHHYHGSTEPRVTPWQGPNEPTLFNIYGRFDQELGAIRCGARLNHLHMGDPTVEWVPMTQPVHRYYALRQLKRLPGVPGQDRPVRIAHSPTYRKIKGTEALLEVVSGLQRKGRKVQVVLIEKLPHGKALELKATCDLCFDSFWLGLQGSGLEAGAMGIPVIAGDPETRQFHVEHLGGCPYVYANDRATLSAALDQLMDSVEHRADAGNAIGWYVWTYHSYEAVAARYLDMLTRRAPHLAERIERARYEAVHYGGDSALHHERPDARQNATRRIRTPRHEPFTNPHNGIRAPKFPTRVHVPARQPLVTR